EFRSIAAPADAWRLTACLGLCACRLVAPAPPPRPADLGVKDGRIAALGRLQGRDAQVTIDATGKVVCPGFIDNHQHSDFTPLVNRACESAVRQGITTVVVGNCGHGCAPLLDPDYIRMVVVGYR